MTCRAGVAAVIILGSSLAAPVSAHATPEPLVQETTALAVALAGHTPDDASLAAFHGLVAAADIGTPAAESLDQVVQDALAVGDNATHWSSAQSQAAGGNTVEVDSLLVRIDYPPMVYQATRQLANVLPEAEAFVRFVTDPRLLEVFAPPYGPSVRTVTASPHAAEYMAFQLALLGVQQEPGGGGTFNGYCDGYVDARAPSRHYGITGELDFCYNYEKVLSYKTSHDVYLDQRFRPFAEYNLKQWIQNDGGYMAAIDKEGLFREQWGYEYTWQPEFETCLLRWGCTYSETPYIAVAGYYDGSTANDQPAQPGYNWI